MSSRQDSNTSSYVFIAILCVLWLVLHFTGKSPLYHAIVNGASMESTLYHDDKGLVFSYEPVHRYDIIVFSACVQNKDSLLVKRVIGLPGDIVECKSHVVYVNGDPIVEFAKDTSANTDFEAVTVPENSYFVLGDNREVSYDSRYSEIGFVPRDKITGIFYKVS